jgi:CelD/BcsL family acetyltransferase involved in cellulose biosynthesis
MANLDDVGTRPRTDLGDPRERAVDHVPPSLRTEDITLAVYSDLRAAEDEWRAFEAVAAVTAFQAFDYLSPWQEHVGRREGILPAVVIGRIRGDETLLILPLAIEPGRMVRRLTFMAQQLADYAAPLLHPRFAELFPADQFPLLWQAVGRKLRSDPRYRHDLVALFKMPELVGDQPNPFLSLTVQLNPNGAHYTNLTGSWESLYETKRSTATRRSDRSKLKRMAALGELRFETPTDRAEILDTLDTLFAQKSKALAKLGVNDVFARPGYREFFQALTTAPAPAAIARVACLKVGDTMAATHLGLEFRARYYYVIASYDDGPASQFGPGLALLRYLMEQAIARGLAIFDFTIGDERYKREWRDVELKLYDHAAPASFRGWPTTLASRTTQSVKRVIKRTPFLWTTYTRLRAGLASRRESQKDAGNDS